MRQMKINIYLYINININARNECGEQGDPLENTPSPAVPYGCPGSAVTVWVCVGPLAAGGGGGGGGTLA